MPIFRLPQVKAQTGHKASASIYGQVKDGLLTRPVQIGDRAVGWPDYEVAAIVNARIAGKTKEEIKALVQRLHSERAIAGEAANDAAA